jgi:5-methylcytosine-specific restriction enzyme A
MPPRPCLDCQQLSTNGSRCPQCERARARTTQRRKRVTRPDNATAAEKRRRAAAVAEWRSGNGDWCPGWGDRAPHPSTDLTADHLRAVAAGGTEGGELRVICRACNSARGARP